MKNHHSQAQLHCLRLLLLSCFHAAFFLASAMTAAPAPSLAVADNFLAALPSMISFKTSSQRLVPFRSKPIGLLRLSCSSALHSLTPFNLSLSKKKFPFVVSLVSRTSDWALRDEDYEEDEEDNALESGVRNGESEWEGDTDEFELSEGDGPEADLSEWEGDNSEDMDDSIEALARKLDLSEGEGPEADLSEWEGENLEEEKNAVQALAQELELPDGKEQEASLSGWKGDNRERKVNVGEAVTKGDSPVNEGISDELRGDSFPEPPEDAKLFVGNLPYDVDSEKLAHLFEKAGIVEVAEVIYSRETGQSRGFGFVSMSTVEEAERAVEMLNRYECEGRLLTVNKASPRGSLPERTRELEPSFRIYAGNLPWQVDDSRLEKVFGRYGQVVNARVVYDRETGRSRGFGFVTMASKNEQEEAIEALDGQTMDGRAIRVNAAEERPRRASF